MNLQSCKPDSLRELDEVKGTGPRVLGLIQQNRFQKGVRLWLLGFDETYGIVDVCQTPITKAPLLDCHDPFRKIYSAQGSKAILPITSFLATIRWASFA